MSPQRRRPRLLRACVLLAAPPVFLTACLTSTEPRVHRPGVDTMVVRLASEPFSIRRVRSLGGYQSNPSGTGVGVHLQTEPIDGLPLVIHIPGVPTRGTFPIGKWDPDADAVLSSVWYVVRKPSIGFGAHAAVTLGYYASLEGGTLEIDDVELPDALGINAAGYVRGRIRTRAAPNPRLVPPGTNPKPDSIEIVAEFHTRLQNWPDGHATLIAADGGLGARSARLMGSGSLYYRGCFGTVPPLVVLGFAAFPPDVPDTMRIWLSTQLRTTGVREMGSIDPAAVSNLFHWPSDFVAVRSGSRLAGSVTGTIRMEEYEPYAPTRWGRARGELQVTLDVRDITGTVPPRQATAALAFEVPVGYFVELNCGTPPPSMLPAGPPARWPFVTTPSPFFSGAHAPWA